MKAHDAQVLYQKLSELLALPAETEWLEFKKAARSFHFDKLGQYFSALSNEACNLLQEMSKNDRSIRTQGGPGRHAKWILDGD